MKFTNPTDGDKGQSVTVTYRDTHSGSDVSTVTVLPGHDVEVDMKDGYEVVLRGSTVHFDNGAPDTGGVIPPAVKVTASAAAEEADRALDAPLDPDPEPAAEPLLEPESPVDDAKPLTPADPARLAEITAAALQTASDTDKTAAGSLTVPALNAALAEAGHEPVMAADRDAAHAAATAE